MNNIAESFIETSFSLGDFVSVEGQDFNQGLIVGGTLLPVGGDGYTLRLNFVIAPVKNDHVPKEDTATIDPTLLTHVDEATQDRLSFIFQEDYKSAIGAEEATIN